MTDSPRLRSRNAAAWWRKSQVGAVLTTVVLAVTLSACSTSSTDTAITVTSSGCATQWQPPRSGAVTFHVSNHTASTVDVQLLGTGTQRVYAEIPTLGTGTTRPLRVTLGPGRYTWQCASLSNFIDTSNPGLVTGPKVRSTPSYIPVGPDDLAAAVDSYRVSVTRGLQTLVGDTDKLRVLVDYGQVQAARAQWLVAHMDYARLGAAYDTFGNYADEIDGRADGLPRGVNDPEFTGFLRLEYGLWHNQPPGVLARVANQLDGFVRGLQRAFPHQLMLATDLPLRAHEILENALQFELTGDTDEGSNTNLGTLYANIEGTQTVMNALVPLLSTRNPSLLSKCQKGLAALATQVGTYDGPNGWTPVQALPTTQREQLDGAVSSLLETLSIVPGSLRLFTVGAD